MARPATRACGGERVTLIACAAIAVLLTACGQENRFIAPPPPKVTVELPVQQTVTPYLEATGNAASVNNIKLVARVQGYVQEIKYQDGQVGEEGHAAVRDRAGALQGSAGAGPSGGGGRQGDARQCRSRIHAASRSCRPRTSRPKPISTRRGPTEIPRAPMCCRHRPIPRPRRSTSGYTTVSAPFDGVVTARKVSVGELVGGDQPSELATIVQINPIWVWFNLSERDVQRVRAADRRNAANRCRAHQQGAGRGRAADRDRLSAPAACSTTRLPRSISRPARCRCAASFENAKAALLPGYFVRVRVPWRAEQALLVPDGGDRQRPGRAATCWSSTPITSSSSAGCSSARLVGDMRVVESGLKPDERVVVAGILDAFPARRSIRNCRPPTSAAADRRSHRNSAAP